MPQAAARWTMRRRASRTMATRDRRGSPTVTAARDPYPDPSGRQARLRRRGSGVGSGEPISELLELVDTPGSVRLPIRPGIAGRDIIEAATPLVEQLGQRCLQPIPTPHRATQRHQSRHTTFEVLRGRDRPRRARDGAEAVATHGGGQLLLHASESAVHDVRTGNDRPLDRRSVGRRRDGRSGVSTPWESRHHPTIATASIRSSPVAKGRRRQRRASRRAQLRAGTHGVHRSVRRAVAGHALHAASPRGRSHDRAEDVRGAVRFGLSRTESLRRQLARVAATAPSRDPTNRRNAASTVSCLLRVPYRRIAVPTMSSSSPMLDRVHDMPPSLTHHHAP